MPQQFVPQYDLKIRGGKHIIEWRFGAHPTVHAVSPSGVPLLVRQPPRAASSSLTVGGPPVPAATSVGGAGAGSGGGPGDALNRGANFSVLPPIRDSGRRVNGDFNLSELDDISLKNEVVRAVRELPERGLQAMLSNMRAQDRDRDGILSNDNVKGTLRKFQVQLSENAQKNLCKKFGQNGERAPVVRYEEMLNYFTKTRIEAFRAPPPKPPTSQTGSKQGGTAGGIQPLQHQQQQQHPRKINMRNRVLFSDRDEAKLIIDLQRQLSNKPVNMADLRGIMIDLDRDRNDFISAPQVETAFSKCGIDLTPDVKAQLLLATDRTGAGIYKIDTLIDYLSRVKPETHNIMIGNNHHPRQARVGQLPMYQNQPTLTAPWEYDNSSQNPLEAQTEFLPDEGFSEGQYYEQQPPSSVPPPPPPPPPSAPEEIQEEGFDVQKWSQDYKYLADAVYNSDTDRSGYMGAEDVRHITTAYSLVYNLKISDVSINSAINTAIDPNYGEVNLEYFIAVLQDLHFKEIQAY